jgi:hypothetical protein
MATRAAQTPPGAAELLREIPFHHKRRQASHSFVLYYCCFLIFMVWSPLSGEDDTRTEGGWEIMQCAARHHELFCLLCNFESCLLPQAFITPAVFQSLQDTG